MFWLNTFVPKACHRFRYAGLAYTTACTVLQNKGALMVYKDGIGWDWYQLKVPHSDRPHNKNEQI